MLKISSTGNSYEVSVYKNVEWFDSKTMLRGCNQFLVSPEKFVSCHCMMSDIFFQVWGNSCHSKHIIKCENIVVRIISKVAPSALFKVCKFVCRLNRVCFY